VTGLNRSRKKSTAFLFESNTPWKACSDLELIAYSEVKQNHLFHELSPCVQNGRY